MGSTTATVVRGGDDSVIPIKRIGCDRTPTHGYATTREEAMAAFAKSWRRERF